MSYRGHREKETPAKTIRSVATARTVTDNTETEWLHQAYQHTCIL